MQIELFDTAEFISINKLERVTSPILFQAGNIPHPDGLISNRIFGVTVQTRRNTFAYIDLQTHFFSPVVYKAIRRMFRNIDSIIDGSSFYSLDKDGYLIPDNENGQTGIEFIYDNWEKIKWAKTDTMMRNERVDLLANYKKSEIFTKYLIVIPPFYRDIKTNAGGSGETGELNKFYQNALRYASMLESQVGFSFQLYMTEYNLQNCLIDIYDYFKTKLEKKNGMLRKYLLGKNVDYSTRTVITAPTYHSDRPEDLMVDFKHAAIPIPQVCSLCLPFVKKGVKDFLEREIFSRKTSFPINSDEHEPIYVALKNPESTFNDKWVEKMIESYVKDPESRFDTIRITTVDGKTFPLRFAGRVVDATTNAEVSGLITRDLTVTDILYQICEDVVKDKHCMITRYPVSDEFGIFFAKIRVLSTTETMPMMVGSKIYKWYPVVEFGIPDEKMATRFVDSVRFSNSFLEGMGGDYDGDQVTVKIAWTQEANEEISEKINQKSFFINAAGRNIRAANGAESLQTYYVMTKEPTASTPSRKLRDDEVLMFVETPSSKITFEMLTNWFGFVSDVTDGKTLSVTKPKYYPTDIVELKTPYLGFTGTTTLGRLIVNKLLIEDCGFAGLLPYQNVPITDKAFGKFEDRMSTLLKDDIIPVDNMCKYTDMRDWFGFQMHAVVCTSFTMASVTEPKEVNKLKKELLKKNAAALKAGDARVASEIEKALVDKTMEVLQDDVGLDLYVSGARGSMGNNFKNINLMRGPVKNVDGSFSILTNSLMEGLDKESMAPHSNTILAGAYPKSVGTAVSGYLAKQLSSAMQTEILDAPGSDCGTHKTLTVTITPNTKNDYMDRYILVNGKLVCLSQDVIDKYIGKPVQMRSPMYCTGTHLCSKCAGENFYKLGKTAIGLTATRIATTLTNLSMKKFHDQTVHTRVIDLDDILL